MCVDCETRFASTMDKNTDITLNNIITTLSVSFFGKKNSWANVIKVSDVILNFARFSVFDRHDTDKSEMIHCFIEATAISLKHKYLAPLWLLPMNINDHKTI